MAGWPYRCVVAANTGLGLKVVPRLRECCRQILAEEVSKSSKGRYLYDVRTERGEGVTQYVTNTTDRLREMRTGGVQNPENFADVI